MRLIISLIILAGLSWLLLDSLSEPIYQANNVVSQQPFGRKTPAQKKQFVEQFPEPGLTFGPDFWKNTAPPSADAPTEASNNPDKSAVVAASLLATPLATPSRTTRPQPTPGVLSEQDVSGAIISSLRDLQQPLPSPRVNPGVHSSSGINPQPQLTPTASPTPDGQLPWVSGISTGFATLAFMHPKARAMALRQVETLKKARVRNTFLAVLADGTFDFDAEFLGSAIQSLSTDGRQLTLLLYLASGPTMRRWDTTPITAAFARYDPESFRAGIRFDPATRSKYTAIVNRLRSVVSTARTTNSENKVLVVPSLEDNLDRESYRAIRELVRPILGSDVQIVRNICPNCWPGNDTDSLGDSIEGHTEALLDRLGPSDVFTLDGLGYRYDNETTDGQLTIQRVQELKALAIDRGVSYFGLWRKQRQGLGNQLIHPDDRAYEVPTDTEIEADIALLRYGLELE